VISDCITQIEHYELKYNYFEQFLCTKLGLHNLACLKFGILIEATLTLAFDFASLVGLD